MSLGDRMKAYYEAIPKNKLMRRTPVIIRIDGKAFHTFTKSFNKPYDEALGEAMIGTMKYLCENIQGCVFGYTQSDEITLVLVDYQTFDTNAWFDYEVQKICSVSSSMATMKFNKLFEDFARKEVTKYFNTNYATGKMSEIYNKAINKGALFDSRAFNIPKEEVTNCILWRQQDATRNSIESLGRAFFSNKQLFKKNGSQIQDMLMEKYNVNWNNSPTKFKRGVACYKENDGKKSVWKVDYEMPIISQDRNYVEKHIIFEE